MRLNPMRAIGPILTRQTASPGLRALGFQQSPVSSGSLVVSASWQLQGYRGVEKGPSKKRVPSTQGNSGRPPRDISRATEA